MSKLDEILGGVYEQGVIDEHGEILPGEMVYPDIAVQPSKAKEDIKDLIRTLIDETFDKDDAKAYEFWQKVENL